jgi:hypothetical protein
MGGLGLLPVLVQEARAGQAALIPLEPRLGALDEPRVGHGAPLRVSPLRVSHIRRNTDINAYINAHDAASGHMGDLPFRLHDQLGGGAIRSAQEPHALDRLTGESGQIPRADEPHPADATAIREGEVLPSGVELPPGLLVLDRAAVALEAGYPLFPGRCSRQFV